MKQLLYILLILTNCTNPKSNRISKNEQTSTNDTIGYRKETDKWFDIAELKDYTDTSKFIARLRYEPPFTTNTVIELDEIANGINLCVKQPKVRLSFGDTLRGNRSLAFNQLCYWYADDEAQKIKGLFDKFNNGQTKNESYCPSCIDKTYWQVEIFDHGKYSAFRKDNISKDDWEFIEVLFDKVKLKKQNEYAIVY